MYPNTTAIDRPDLEIALVEHLALAGSGFAGTKMFPILNSDKSSGKYHKITFAELDKQILDNKKQSSTGYNRVQRKTGKDSYDCQKYGLEEELDFDDVQRLGVIQSESIVTSAVGFNNLRSQEIRIKKTLWNTELFKGSSQQKALKPWNDAAATVKKDIDLAKLRLKKNIGGTNGPGTRLVLLCSDEMIVNILASDLIQKKTEFTRRIEESDPNLEQLAQYLRVDEIIEASSRVEGELIFTNEFAMLAIVSASEATQLVPRLGNTWLWTKSTGSNNTVETYRDENKEADIIRVKHHVDEKLMCAACGILFTDVTK